MNKPYKIYCVYEVLTSTTLETNYEENLAENSTYNFYFSK